MLVIRYRDQVEFNVADDGTRESYFVLGVRKCGSSILNSIVGAMAQMNNLNFVDVGGTLFQTGLRVTDWQWDEELCALLGPGNVYGGFRNFPHGLAKSTRFWDSRKILMVRDPRDALVSEYFSNAYSHSVPQTGDGRVGMLAERSKALNSDLQTYVLKMAPSLKRALGEYVRLLDDPTTLLLRYEDRILKKSELIRDICAFFSWSISDIELGHILGWADIVPDKERPMEFIRKVRPNDHVEKLAPATIARLNEIFWSELSRFGYGQPN
jgi:hypothetical protein